MPVDKDVALQRALEQGDDWGAWRALRLSGENPGELPDVPGQQVSGGITGAGGTPSPGATGSTLAHLAVIGCDRTDAGVRAAAWLEEVMTPARAWLDHPANVPGEHDTPAAARVWATAAATCSLLAVGRDPGPRPIDLLRGEADQSGRFTGGAYPTFAAAGAFWLAHGPKSEMAEWALRWAREWREDWWGPREFANALFFWGTAGIPLEHPTVEAFLDELRDGADPAGWPDLGLTIATLELLDHFGA
jgi:hypothetical protein